MNMDMAVKRGFRRAFVWSGRASRSEFWFLVLASAMFSMLCVFIGAVSHFWAIMAAWPLLFALPTLGAAARRLHDSDRSALWLLMAFVPYGGLVLMIFYCLPGTLGPNRYGRPGDNTAVAKAYRKLGRQYEKSGESYLAAGYTVLAVVYGNEASMDVQDDLMRLSGQRENLGDIRFRRRMYEVLDGRVEELMDAMEAVPPGRASAPETDREIL
ncbi:DUF805 domain-containing protein [Actinomadura montaniterrae]|uniref:DUF805 domain-containing protein n=1 Tax=Actinomadura montaniterrae TaxID=1803903 RepID=A0A6L3W6I7_9ACTN|nr:DUF805 domain-containing protein [Actinomadura montaniterrae]KAB2389930.1 DUF805 domain-containing protein [Actinomadura montaniterrae]